MLKAKKKSLCLILSFVMLLALACGAWALEPNGDGVYEIWDEVDLREFAAMVNAGSTDIDAKLMADITLTENWTPMGGLTYNFEDDYSYTGTFDGNGKMLSNLKVASEDLILYDGDGYNAAGFFGQLGAEAVVKNLTIKSADIQLRNFEDEEQLGATVGAIAAYNTGTIENSYVSGGILSSACNAGGIVGINRGTISGCTVKGVSKIDGQYHTGGVAGIHHSPGVIMDCTVSDIDAIVSDNPSAGVAGGCSVNGVIMNCTVSGISMISSGVVGGVAGDLSGAVINCTVSVIGAMDKGSTGGIVGRLQASGTMQNCVLLPNVNGTTITGTNSQAEGGVLGVLNGYPANPALLNNVLNCFYPSEGISFDHGEDKPIGNVPLDDMIEANGVGTYDVNSDDADLPAIAATIEQGITFTMLVGDTLELDVSTFPGTSGDFVCGWDSEDDSIVKSVAGARGLTATLSAYSVGTAKVMVTIRGTLNVDLTCTVNVIDEIEPNVTGTPADGLIYLGDGVNRTYDFSPYIPIGLDDSGLLDSGLAANIVGVDVVLTGKAENSGTYSYDVTFRMANGTEFTQTVYITVQNGNRPDVDPVHGGGSSNCNALGLSALSLLGLALVLRKKS